MIVHTSRRSRLAALGTAAVLALAACSGGSGGDDQSPGEGSVSSAGSDGPAVKGGTLNMLGAGDVDYMDPNVSYYSIGYLVHRLWSRQLFTYPALEGKTTTAVPDIAEEVPTQDNGGISKDGLTVTVKMRQGVKWNTSPEREVTAADMVRGVKRTCNPVQPFGGLPDYMDLLDGFKQFCDDFAKVPGNAAAIKKYVEDTDLPGVVAKDPRTVVFTLTHPASYFVDMLTMTAFSPAPVEVLDYLPGSQDLGQHQVADGPYQIDSWSPTKEITLSRNPAWDESTDEVRKAYVDKVVINETVTQESTQQQLQTGTPSADMEFNNYPPPSQLPGLIASNDPLLNLGETSSSNPYIVFNTVSPNNGNALAKPEVRQALSHALNRDHLIQVLGGPKVNPPLTHVLPDNIVGSKDIDLYPFDTDKAKQLLEQAGVSDLTIKFLYRPDSEGSRKAFQAAQQDLSDVGITVEGVPAPTADFYTKYVQVPSVAQRGVWDLALAGWGSDWYGDAAVSYFGPLFSGKPSFPPVGSNFGFYDSAEANDLIQQAMTAPTESEAADLWAQADEQVMKDAAFFPITQPVQANYHAEQVHNAVYVENYQNFDPANVWLSEDKQGG
jgi:peptide/nickel transport system substrate-binding protein